MNKVKALTFGGIICALSVAVSLLGNIVPVTKFIGPIVAGFFIMILREYYGLATGLVTFAATSLLLIFLSPSKASAYVFVVLLGYYPMVRQDFDKIKSVLVRGIVKALLFESIGILTLFLGLKIMTDFTARDNYRLLIVGAIVLYNIFVIVYDLFIYGLKKYFGDSFRQRFGKILK